MRTFFMVIALLVVTLLPFAAMAELGDSGGGPTAPPATPEIPAGAAPIIVAGIMGAVLLVRNRRNKAKKD